MGYKLGVLLDLPENINPRKDTSLAIMIAAQKRDWEVSFFSLQDLQIDNGDLLISSSRVELHENDPNWHTILERKKSLSTYFDAILIRKDPPFDMNYVYSTYLLEIAERQGTPVLNRPSSIRDCNEKLFALEFANCCPPHIVSASKESLQAFYEENNDVIFKPLDGMGGQSIFRAKPKEHNLSVILENLTQNGQIQTMGQRFIPEIARGDTRIIMLNGEAIPFGLARIPAKGETRGNLAAGGTGKGRELSERDLFICSEIGETLRSKGLYFVGIDVIGDYLTEINVTCPTCVVELNKIFDLDIGNDYIAFIEDTILTS
ncbi:MAG: glutathione synthase [Pseudomonadota bacterium]|nr:glutathione synthase [Pseudomonadota bacterium]